MLEGSPHQGAPTSLLGPVGRAAPAIPLLRGTFPSLSGQEGPISGHLCFAQRINELWQPEPTPMGGPEPLRNRGLTIRQSEFGEAGDGWRGQLKRHLGSWVQSSEGCLRSVAMATENELNLVTDPYLFFDLWATWGQDLKSAGK